MIFAKIRPIFLVFNKDLHKKKIAGAQKTK